MTTVPEENFRQWRIVVEFYPNGDFGRTGPLWYWEVREKGELFDAGYTSHADQAAWEAGQVIEKNIAY